MRIISLYFYTMSKQTKEQELEAIKSKVKNPEIKKSIDEKLKAINEPVKK